MLRNFGIALFVIAAALTSRASASPLITYYNDPKAWNSSIIGLIVVPYTGVVTETDISTTAETDSSGVCCNIISSIASPSVTVPFKTFSLNFSALGDAIDEFCFGVPLCTETAVTEKIITFPTPIRGFSSNLATVNNPDLQGIGSNNGMINGDIIPFAVVNNFFGTLDSSSISSLDFAPSCLLCDDSNNQITLDIDVVYADEPSAFACLLAPLLIFLIASVRFGRSQLI